MNEIIVSRKGIDKSGNAWIQLQRDAVVEGLGVAKLRCFVAINQETYEARTEGEVLRLPESFVRSLRWS
jgi:hypothetical protein